MKVNIEAANFKAFSKNTLKGFVDLTVTGAGIVIKECAWHEKNGKEWISPPGKPWTDKKTGEVKYTNLLEWTTREAKDAFQEAAVAAIYRLIGSGRTPADDPSRG